MDILPLHFRVLYLGGLWWETNEQHWLSKYIWKPFIINMILFCAILMLDPLAAPNTDIKDVPQFLFLSLTVVAMVLKMVNFLAKRKSIIELLNMFREPICVPQTTEEKDVLKKNSWLIPIVFKCYLFFAYSSMTLFSLLPLLHVKEGTGNMSFPFETYEIFSKDNVAYYAVTYAFQIIASTIVITLNTSFDTILAGFACLTCSQIDLCCYRFASGNGRAILSNIKWCAVHHTIIQNIVQRLKSIFMNVVVPFLFVSLITICTSMYNLSQIGFGRIESIPFIVYTSAMLTQVFFYCWFGNELKLKGIKISQTFYNYDWRALTPVEKKNLLCTMIVCQKPLSLSYHGYCTISLEIYVWILNASYALYNILNAVTNDN